MRIMRQRSSGDRSSKVSSLTPSSLSYSSFMLLSLPFIFQVKFQIIMSNNTSHTFTLTSHNAVRERDRLWNKILALQTRLAESGETGEEVVEAEDDYNYGGLEDAASIPAHIPPLDDAINSVRLASATPTRPRYLVITVIISTHLILPSPLFFLFVCFLCFDWNCSNAESFVVHCEAETSSGIPLGARSGEYVHCSSPCIYHRCSSHASRLDIDLDLASRLL